MRINFDRLHTFDSSRIRIDFGLNKEVEPNRIEMDQIESNGWIESLFATKLFKIRESDDDTYMCRDRATEYPIGFGPFMSLFSARVAYKIDSNPRPSPPLPHRARGRPRED